MEFLKLLTLDEDGLQVVSAHVQDAVIKVGELKYLGRSQQFVVPMNRFAWELSPDTTESASAQPRRHRSILQFNRVSRVRSIGLSRDSDEAVLSVLAISYAPGEAPSGTVELTFSESAAILLDIECIEARLTDTGAAWEASGRPQHDIS